jgi:hypothetical protein
MTSLPGIDGVENIRIDTIQGELNYKRTGKDGKVPVMQVRTFGFTV